MAPEVLLGDAYNEKADIFSFGLILFETSTRRVPAARDLKRKFEFNIPEFESMNQIKLN